MVKSLIGKRSSLSIIIARALSSTFFEVNYTSYQRLKAFLDPFLVVKLEDGGFIASYCAYVNLIKKSSKNFLFSYL
jgi:hypothetical protein